METCVLLSARRYDFTGTDGGQVVGVTLTYLTGDVENSPDNRGAAPLSITAPVDLYAQLGPLPGLYDMDFKQRPGKGGKPTLQCTGVRFQTALDGLLSPVQAGK